MRGESADKTLERSTKREAKLNESSSLYKKAEAMDANAAALDEHIKKLSDGLATVDPYDKDSRKPFETQIDDLKKQQQKLKSDANDLRTKGDAARAEGESIPAATAQAAKPYAGRTMSKANVEKYAKDKNISIDAATKFWRDDQGVTIR
jgi:hypothetical protein